jgi:hypothetical protein
VVAVVVMEGNGRSLVVMTWYIFQGCIRIGSTNYQVLSDTHVPDFIDTASLGSYITLWRIRKDRLYKKRGGGMLQIQYVQWTVYYGLTSRYRITATSSPLDSFFPAPP